MPDQIVLTAIPDSSSAFVLTHDTVAPFILNAPNNPALVVQLGTNLSGSVDLTGPTSLRGFEGFVSGSVSDSEVLIAFIAPYTFTIDAAHCFASAMEVPLADIVFSIKKTSGNVTSQIGTVTFSANNAHGVFNFASLAIMRGDLITIQAPASPDTSISNIAFLVAE